MQNRLHQTLYQQDSRNLTAAEKRSIQMVEHIAFGYSITHTLSLSLHPALLFFSSPSSLSLFLSLSLSLSLSLCLCACVCACVRACVSVYVCGNFLFLPSCACACVCTCFYLYLPSLSGDIKLLPICSQSCREHNRVSVVKSLVIPLHATRRPCFPSFQ